jgi:hypothetical protein
MYPVSTGETGSKENSAEFASGFAAGTGHYVFLLLSGEHPITGVTEIAAKHYYKLRVF